MISNINKFSKLGKFGPANLIKTITQKMEVHYNSAPAGAVE